MGVHREPIGSKRPNAHRLRCSVPKETIPQSDVRLARIWLQGIFGHDNCPVEHCEMTLPMSIGLQQQLREDPSYVGRYERLVRDVENLSSTQLKEDYEP